jgi:hypothetical protein
MVSPLFTAFALIATGQVEIPAAPAQPLPLPQIRGEAREQDARADRLRPRRS